MQLLDQRTYCTTDINGKQLLHGYERIFLVNVTIFLYAENVCEFDLIRSQEDTSVLMNCFPDQHHISKLNRAMFFHFILNINGNKKHIANTF